MAKAPDGTVAKLQDGSTVVKRGGQWVPAGSLYVGPGPKLDATERKELLEARQNAEKAGKAIADTDAFMSLNERQRSGQLIGMPVVRDIVGAFDPEVGTMNAITNRLTPSQREAGSGAMSDRDVEMYRNSTVSMGKTGPANRNIATLAKAGAMRQKDHAAFLDYFGRINGSLNGAQEMWDEYKTAEPVYDHERGTIRQARTWRAHFGVGGDKAAPKPQGAPRPAAKPAAKRPPLSDIFGN